MTNNTAGAIDRALAMESNFEKSKALESIQEENDQVKVKATGPMTFSIRGQKYEVSDKKAILCSPRVAIQIITLYGRKGLYHGRDQSTMLTRNKYDFMDDNRRQKYERRTLNFQDHFAYHLDEEDSGHITTIDDPVIEETPAPVEESETEESEPEEVVVGESAAEQETKKKSKKG